MTHCLPFSHRMPQVDILAASLADPSTATRHAATRLLSGCSLADGAAIIKAWDSLTSTLEAFPLDEQQAPRGRHSDRSPSSDLLQPQRSP